MKAMKVCILYFSQTGNTKKFAETISDSLKIQAIHDITDMEPSIVADYDTIIIGTPVHGFNPSKESMSFVESLPEAATKRSYSFVHTAYGKETHLAN